MSGINIRIYVMSEHLKFYAVVGNPIAHSKSPDIHAQFAAQCGIALRYKRVLAPVEGFTDTVNQLRAAGLQGCNVTVPFKLDAFAYAYVLSDAARWAGAVNTLTFKDDGKAYGDNTDGVGLVRDITRNLKAPINGKRVALLGAGGAGRGALAALIKEAPSHIVLINRTEEKARQTAREFNGLWREHPSVFPEGFGDIHIMEWTKLGYQESNFPNPEGMGFDVVINATSSGLSDSFTPIQNHGFYLNENALAYDMMYGKQTGFMTWAQSQGAQVADGWGMLVEQAAASFQIWHGIAPDTAPLLQRGA